MKPPSGWGTLWPGGILVLLGVLFLLHNLGWLDLSWRFVWPGTLIVVGVLLLVRRWAR